MFYYSLFTEPPSFQSKLENVTVLSYSWQGAYLLCQAQRGPAPVITWYKTGDGSLEMLQNSTSVVYNYDTYSRRLDEVKCIASNSFGSDNKTLLINTQGMSKVVPFILCFFIFIAYVCVSMQMKTKC